MSSQDDKNDIEQLKKRLAECEDELEEKQIKLLELEIHVEKTVIECETSVNGYAAQCKTLLNEVAKYKKQANDERLLNDQLLAEVEALKKENENWKAKYETSHKQIAVLEIAVEKNENHERVFLERIKELEEAQENDLEKIADLETHVTQLQQALRDYQASYSGNLPTHFAATSAKTDPSYGSTNHVDAIIPHNSKLPQDNGHKISSQSQHISSPSKPPESCPRPVSSSDAINIIEELIQKLDRFDTRFFGRPKPRS